MCTLLGLCVPSICTSGFFVVVLVHRLNPSFLGFASASACAHMWGWAWSVGVACAWFACDLQEERERERDQFMFQIREQGRENKLLEQLVGLFLLPSEMSKVRRVQRVLPPPRPPPTPCPRSLCKSGVPGSWHRASWVLG